MTPRIRTLAVALIVTAMHAANVQAQSSHPATKEQALKQLMQIERDVVRTNNECDYDFFRRVEAAEFIFTSAAGKVITRDEDLAGEHDCRKSDVQATIDEPRLLFYGTYAVLSARNTSTRRSPTGESRTSQTRFTDVFVWRDGRWQMIAGHSSRIATPQ